MVLRRKRTILSHKKLNSFVLETGKFLMQIRTEEKGFREKPRSFLESP